jgi:multiple sugar transport system permease protein
MRRRAGRSGRVASLSGHAGALVAPALVVLVLLAVVPIAGAMWTSLHHDLGLGDRRFAGLGNYAALWTDPAARGALTFTLIFVAVSVPVELVLGLGMALVMHHALVARGAVRALLLVPWAIPTVVTSWMWLYIFDGDRGIMNYLVFGSDTQDYVTFLRHTGLARFAVIVADVWKTTPFVALLILAGLQSIPGEVYEAARVDGAGRVRRFVAITLPLLRPAILVALLFRTIDAFRVFDLVYVMTGGRADTSVLQYLGYQRLVNESDYGMGSALAVVVFVLIAIVSVFYVRWVGAALVREGRT